MRGEILAVYHNSVYSTEEQKHKRTHAFFDLSCGKRERQRRRRIIEHFESLNIVYNLLTVNYRRCESQVNNTELRNVKLALI
jgi:hypothetical protein